MKPAMVLCRTCDGPLMVQTKKVSRWEDDGYCRAKTPAECRLNNEVEHITKKLQPEPDRPKDFLTHNLFWKRSGKLNFDTHRFNT